METQQTTAVQQLLQRLVQMAHRQQLPQQISKSVLFISVMRTRDIQQLIWQVLMRWQQTLDYQMTRLLRRRRSRRTRKHMMQQWILQSRVVILFLQQVLDMRHTFYRQHRSIRTFSSVMQQVLKRQVQDLQICTTTLMQFMKHVMYPVLLQV